MAPASGLTATPGINEVLLSWVNPEDPAPEGVYVEVVGPQPRVIAIPGAVSEAKVSGLRNGVQYAFRVVTATRDGSAEPSGIVRATPTTGVEGVVAGVIVEFAETIQVSAGAQSVPGDDRITTVDLSVAEKVTDDAVLVEFSEPVDLDTAERIASDLAADELVQWAEPDQFLFTASDTPAPSSIDASRDSWNLSGTYGVDADAVDDVQSAGEGVTVAVIDTGITNHPDLQVSLVDGFDFVSSPEQLAAVRQANAPPVAFDADYQDPNTYGSIGRDANPQDPGDWRDTTPTRASSWHGTKMAGLIHDVAPGASIQPIRALSWRGGLLSDIAASITWASGGDIDGAPANANTSKVINMSFAVETICPTALQQAIDAARERGSILIAAAGNANDDAAKYAPGNCNGVITVGATTDQGMRADYSNYGPTIDIAAPGGDTTTPVFAASNTGTTTPSEPTRTGDFGTSVSAAHVSAAAAILAARNATITPDEAFTTLTGNDFTKNFANPTCDTNPDYTCGNGILTLAQIATTSSGDQDYAMQFTGTTNSNSTYAEATNTTFTSTMTTSYTFSAWVKPTSCGYSGAGQSQVIWKQYTLGLQCESSTNSWQYTIGTGTGWGTTVNTGIAPRLNEWQHLAVARSSSATLFYVNGQLAHSNGALTMANSSFPVFIGVRRDSGSFTGFSSFFLGQIDQVKIYDRDLDQPAIAQDMHSWALYTGTTGAGVTVNAANGLALFDFNEGPAGTTGTGTVYNRAENAAAGTNLRTVNAPTYTDIKQTTSNGNNTVVTFPRSYLTAAGGWRVPEGVTTAETLVVAGGGGGGDSVDNLGWQGAGGGAGSYLASDSSTLVSGTVIRAQVGMGGKAGLQTSLNVPYVDPTNGQNSVLGTITAAGGGFGGYGGAGGPSGGINGGSGGSGGGGGMYIGQGGTGTVGQGYSGGNSAGSGNLASGGGGGSGSAGTAGTGTGTSATGGSGGQGTANSISGASVYYAAGGNAKGCGANGSASGQGQTAVGTNGAAMTGSGGGGGGDSAGCSTADLPAGSGGSGVVIVSYSTAAASGTDDLAMSFNGTNQIASSPDNAAFDLVNAFTIEAWVKPDTACSSRNSLVQKGGSYIFLCVGGTWRYGLVGSGGTYVEVDTTVGVQSGSWQHVAITRAANTNAVQFYLNGQLAYTGAAGGAGTGAIANTTTPLEVASEFGNISYVDGQIDELRLFTVERSAAQIAADMHTYGPVSTANLVAYYDFNEGPAAGAGSGTVYNRASGATRATNLTTSGSPTYSDVKSTAVSGSNTVVTFPRSYLTAGGGWQPPSGVETVAALAVGGGGGGGAWVGGGGGGGGVTSDSSVDVSAGTSLGVTVGQGGIGAYRGTSAFVSGSNGGSSTLGSSSAVTALGGGVGASWDSQAPGSGSAVATGGGGSQVSGTYSGGVASSGRNGGSASTNAQPHPVGGGGGAGGSGSSGSGSGNSWASGDGGVGVASTITGTSVYYGGGGGGSAHGTWPGYTSWDSNIVITAGNGGTGGGGTGGRVTTATLGTTVVGGSGTAGLGGGGGGAANMYVSGTSYSSRGGDGGSGVVIVSYATASAQTACTPESTQYISGGTTYRVVAFKDTGSCTWTVPAGVTSVNYLVVAGGGGGGSRAGGGAGAGGMLESSSSNSVTAGQDMTVTVGPGGAGGAGGSNYEQVPGTSGGNSSISGAGLTSSIVAIGGGAGGAGATIGSTGGSGGGSLVGAGGTGTTGQGNSGGSAVGTANQCTGSTNGYCAGGGGGKSAAGEAADAGGNNRAGNGGAGGASSILTASVATVLEIGAISGSSVTFAGGGGGGIDVGGTAGTGGSGGGGTGGTGTVPGANGLAATGGGGGGGGYQTNLNGYTDFSGAGGSGGSGVVVLRYAVGVDTTCTASTVLDGSDTVVSITAGTACSWTPPVGVTSVDALLVAGGGSGGGRIGGGGGGGEVKAISNQSVTALTAYSFTVGTGGVGTVNGGADGGDTTAFGVTVNGGGGGGSLGNVQQAGQPGGSGGGGACFTVVALGSSVLTGGGLGHDGGTGNGGSAGACVAAGGGGAGTAGGDADAGSQSGGAGGDGAESSITGTAVVYGAGGGGGVNGPMSAGVPGTGGAGGGGAGGARRAADANGLDATGVGAGGGGGSNCGDAGGGACTANYALGGDGGAGIVILRYSTPAALACTPLSYSSGNYTVVEFQGAGTCSWTPPSGVSSVDVLAVGGGGGGGAWVGGGGGGGGVTSSSVGVTSGGTVSVTVGAGGRGAVETGSSGLLTTRATGGGTSSFGSVSAAGGGEGASYNAQAPGGSGYATGGGGGSGAGGTGSAYSGGAGSSSTPYPSGGGAGAGGDGTAGSVASYLGGAGGIGASSTITGATVFYGGGGGGGVHGVYNSGPWGTSGVGGIGGGGAGASATSSTDTPRASSGVDGLGGGGGGASAGSLIDSFGGDGGDGVVIVRYSNLPDAPTGLTATAGEEEVSLAWSAPAHSGSSAISSYTIEYDDQSDFSTASSTTSLTTSETITGLTANTLYYFRVKATNSSGSGDWSSSATARPFGAVTQFAVTMTGGTTALSAAAKTAGTPFDVRVTAQDANGLTNTDYTGTVTLSSTNAFKGTFTATISSGGYVDSVSVTPTIAGSNRTIAATDGTVTDSDASGNFTVNAGTATKLQVLLPGETADPGSVSGKSGTPTDDVAGSGITVTVNAVDANWNVVSSQTQSIAITSTDGAATLPSNAQLVSGTKDFSVTLKTAGSQTITATVASGTSLTAGTSASVTVTPGSASLTTSTVVASPTSIDADGTSASTITVTLKDAYSNLLTASGGTVVISSDIGTVSATTNNNDGTYTASLTSTTSGTATVSATLGGNALSATATVTLLSTAATKLVITGTGLQTAGGSQTITITAKDSRGNTATSYTGSQSLTFSGASSSASPVTAPTVAGTAFGSSTSLTFTNGVATATMILYAAESANVSVTDGSISSSGSDNLSVTVSAAAANKLAIATQPVAGASEAVLSTQPVVRILDAYGNLTTSTDTVTVSASGGTLGGSEATAGKAAVSGTATFTNLTFAGSVSTNYTLTFASTGLTSVTSSSITPSGPGTASKLAFTVQPSNVVAGVGISPAVRVTVQDAYDNTVTSATNSITFAIGTNPGSGSLSGTVVKTAVNGVASVSDLSINKSGTGYTLTASASGLTGATSSTFTVSAAAADSIAVNAGNNQSATVGTAVGTLPSVVVTDAYGNAVQGTSVTFAVATGGGTATGLSATTNASGIATVGSWTLGTTAGSNTLTASSGSLTGSPVTFTATGTADAATTIALDAGDGQSATAGTAVSTAPSVLVTDTYGNPVAGESVTFTVASGGGSLASPGSPATVTTNASGIATSPAWTLGTTAGSNTVTAASGSLSGSPVLFTATGTAAAAMTLAITGSSSQTAGNAQTITITAKDANGNTDTSYSGAKSLTFSGANSSTNPVTVPTVAGTDFGTATSLTFTNGVATASMVLYAAETATVVVTDSNGLTSAGSGDLAVTVDPAALDQFAVTMTGGSTPLSAVAKVAGTPFSVRVSAQDEFGNDQPSFTGAVSLTSTAWVGTVTATIAANGYVDSIALTPTVANTGQYVAAGDGSLTTTQASSAFSVNPGLAAKVLVTQEPVGGQSGGLFATQPIAVIADAYDNTVTASTADISVALRGADTWTAGSPGSVTGWMDVAYGNSTWVAVTNGGRIYSSSNGVSWTERASVGAGFSSVAYGNSLWVAVGGSAIYTSPNGETWTSRSSNGLSNLLAVEYGNGAWFALPLSGTSSLVSVNGTSWTTTATPAPPCQWEDLAFGGGQFVALDLGCSGTDRVMYSADGSTWNLSNALPNATYWYALAYGNGTWVAVGENRIATSADGITWTARTSPTGKWRSVAFGDGVFQAIELDGTKVALSSDGVTWTTSSPLPSSSWVTLGFGAGQWVAMSYAGPIQYSVTGLGGTLTIPAVAGESEWTNLTYSGVAGTNRYLVFTSPGLTPATSAAFTVTPGAPSTSTSTITSSAASIQVGGSGATITVQLEDAAGNAITTGGATVTMSTTRGSIGSVTDNNNGTYTATLSPGTSPGTATVSASVGGSALSSTTSVTIAAGDAATLALTRAAVGTASGAAFTTQPQITIRDVGGNRVTTDSSTVVTATVSAGGTLVGTTTATASAGIATFSGLGITGTAGTTYTITFSSGSLTSATQDITVTVGAATQIVIVTEPVAGNSGATLATQPVVRIADSGGNTVTSNSSTDVTVTASGGTLAGTTTVRASAGVVTFAGLTFAGSTTSTYTLTFAASGLTSAVSSTIQPAAAGDPTQLLMVTQPVAGASGSTLTTAPVVRLADSAGNTVTSDSTTSVSVVASGGTLTGTSSQTAASGQATFSGLSFAGLTTTNYTLTFSASGLASVTSANFKPNAAGPLAKFAVTQSGGTTPLLSSYTAGTNISMRVTAQDSGGNTVTSFNQRVDLSSAAWSGTVTAQSFTSGIKDSVSAVARTAGTTNVVRAVSSTAGITTDPASSTFAVVAGAANRLLLDTSPVAGPSGDVMTTQPVVQVVDNFNNVVTTSSASVTVTAPTTQWRWASGVGANADINAVATDGAGTWVGVACNGSGAKSTDGGNTWSWVSLPVATCWHDVAYGNGLWVAVMSSGLYTSADGSTWTQRLALGMDAVAYGNGVWVAVDDTNRTYTSSDGLTWTQSSIYSHTDVIFADGVFWARSSTTIYRSFDGVLWSTFGYLAVSSSDVRDMAVGNGRIVVAYNGGVTTSLTTSSSWTTTSITGDWFAVGFGGGEFRAGNLSSKWIASSDGVNWSSSESVNAYAGGSGPGIYTIAYGAGTWVTGGNAGATAILINTASNASLGGTTTVSAVNGIATFSDLTFAGVPATNYTLQFASTGLTGTTSTISPSSVGTMDVAQALVTAGSGSIAAGSGSTNITVQLRDSAGNNVSTAGQTVALSVNSGTLSGVTDNGNGTYTATLTASALQTYGVVRASVNGTAVTSAATVVYTTGPAAELAIDQQPVAGASGALLSTQPRVTVLDANGNRLTEVSGTITVTASGGTLTGSQASGFTLGATSDGIAAFSNLRFAGVVGTPYTLTFAMSGLTSAVSDPFTPTGAGAATTIAVSSGNSQSASIGTAVATPPSVLVTDAGGNPVSGISVTFAVASGGGSATGTTATTDASGIATVGSWTLGSTTGANTLRATSSGLTGSPVTFTATAVAGPLASLTLSRSSVGTASGAAFTTQPQITLKDASNNTLSLDSSSVVTATVSSGGQLVGTTTATASSGVATFSDLGITGTAGSTYTITYSTGGFSTTQNVTVTVGSPAALAVNTSAAGATYGNAWTTQPVIEIQDSGGNRVTGDSSTVVTISVSTGGTLSGTASATASSGLATFSGLYLTGEPATYTLTYSSGALTTTSQVLALSQASQTITFNALSTMTYGDAPFGLGATASSGLSVSYSSADSAVCSVASGVVTITGAGTCTITATQAGNSYYSPASPVAQAFTVNKASQATLTMTSPDSAIYGETITLAASGGSGTGSILFQKDAGTCTVSGSTLTLGDANSLCQVSAIRGGDGNYNSVTSATQTITITEAGQTVAFTSSVPTAPQALDTYTPTATAISDVTGLASGDTPTFSTSGACTLSGSVVTFTAGTCTITATASGNTNFDPSPSVTQVIEVGSINQTITFAQPSTKTYGSPSFALGATASSGLTVEYALASGITACSVSVLGVVTLLDTGTCRVIASQPGQAGIYAPASNVTRAFQVVAALPSAPTITSASASSQAITVGVAAPGFTGAPSETIAAYQVVATPVGAGTTVTSSSCTSSPCTITGLVNGTAYTVTVAAINSAGTGPASSATGALTPATAAFAVGSLAATPGDTNVALTWTALSNDQLGGGTFTRYEVSRRVAGTSSWTLVTDALTTQSTATYTVTGLDNGTSYDFQVVAITSANASEIPGNTAQVVQYPSTVPSVPRTLTVLAATPTDVQFSWSAPLSDGGSPLSTPYYRTTVTSTSTGAATPITCSRASLTQTFCSASGLTNGAVYVFTVEARNRMGYSTIASTTYNVPSADATLSDLEVTSSSGAVALSPAFASGTTAYAATVVNAVASVTVTPTTTMPGSTVEVDGVAVISGEESEPIVLAVGVNEIEVEVTASDTRFTETYTITITRSPASGGGSSTGGGATPNLPITPPANVVNGDALGAVTVNGEVETGVVLVKAPSNSGWEAMGSDFQMMVETETSSGTPEPLGSRGAMQVPQGGRIVIAGDGYMPETMVNVFAIPRVSARMVGKLMARSISGAVYVGSAPVSQAGTVSGTFTVPMGMNVGDYVLQINGETTQAQVRSINLQMNVLPAPPTMRAGMIREAAFYQGKSAKLSDAGQQKLRSMVAAIPKGAQDVSVVIVGVSVALESIDENLDLARDRAQGIAKYLENQGVSGTYTVSVSTTFTIDAAERSLSGDVKASGLDMPMESSAGKPLTTASITFEAPNTF